MKKNFQEDNENDVFEIDEELKKIELNKIEIECLNRVYDQLGKKNITKHTSKHIYDLLKMKL